MRIEYTIKTEEIAPGIVRVDYAGQSNANHPEGELDYARLVVEGLNGVLQSVSQEMGEAGGALTIQGRQRHGW